jgi:tRNA(fMet)-specific endonuclease VapC
VSARFLLDTNALSEPLRPAPDAQFLSRFSEHRSVLAIAAPAWHEALFGLQRMPPGRKRDAVDGYLHGVIAPTVDVLPYDAEAARWHAVERARLERAGRRVPFADGTIAAVAVRFGIPLVTRNRRDFEGFAGLEVVDWTAPPPAAR